MVAKAKASSSSCLSFLKDALLLPTRNAKLFVPVLLLLAVPDFLIQATNVLFINPLTQDLLRRIYEIKNMDPSSADYAELVAEVLKQAKQLAAIAIAIMIVTFALGFAKQILAFFAASTTYSGDRYSLPELFSKVIMQGRRLTGPLVTAAMAGVLEIACGALLAALLQLAMRRSGSGALYVAFLFVLPFFLAFLYLNVVLVVAVAASVADPERRGVSALRQAWRLMTRVWGKEGCVLVVVVHLVAMVPSPLYAVALGYSNKSTPMALALLAVYALLSGLVQIFCFAAATVYYYQAMESKEEEMAHGDYVNIPATEATVV